MWNEDFRDMKPVVMDFSGIYREEDFLKEEEAFWLDCRKLQGVNCYCSQEAEQEILDKIRELPVEGIRFLDSGNYHYLTKIWLEKMETPFSLLVFDNHTDMQEAAFFGLLSCGSWAGEVLENHPMLEGICVAGPSCRDFQEYKGENQEKLTRICREELLDKGEQLLLEFLEKDRELPLYISLDKDVLRTSEARTNWDQGDLSLEQLFKWLELAFEKRKVLAVDICGENPPDTARPISGEDLQINSRTNRELLLFLKKHIKSQVILD